jgi:hypothetical protein
MYTKSCHCTQREGKKVKGKGVKCVSQNCLCQGISETKEESSNPKGILSQAMGTCYIWEESPKVIYIPSLNGSSYYESHFLTKQGYKLYQVVSFKVVQNINFKADLVQIPAPLPEVGYFTYQ